MENADGKNYSGTFARKNVIKFEAKIKFPRKFFSKEIGK